MQQAIVDLLAKRRDRCIAIMLGVKEREIDRHLPDEAKTKLRKVILDQVNEFYDVALELMGSLDTDSTVVNQLWLDKIDSLHDSVTEMHAVIVGSNGHG